MDANPQRGKGIGPNTLCLVVQGKVPSDRDTAVTTLPQIAGKVVTAVSPTMLRAGGAGWLISPQLDAVLCGHEILVTAIDACFLRPINDPSADLVDVRELEQVL